MFLLFNLVVLLLTGAVAWWAPGVRRVNGGLVFQEGASPSVKEAGQSLLSEYRKHVLLALAAAVVAVLGLQWRLGDSYWRLIYTIFLLLCGALTFRIQWRMRDLRIAHSQRREAFLAINELEELPRWPWLAAMTLLVLAALYLSAIWHTIPARFPVHWDSAGTANGWSERTIRGVFGPILIGGVIVAGLYGVLQIAHWVFRRQWQTWDDERRQSELFRLRVITFVPVWIALGLSGLGLWMPRGGGEPNLLAFLAAVAAYLAGLVVLVNLCARQPRGSR
jgi:uncharacterized membrane protein